MVIKGGSSMSNNNSDLKNYYKDTKKMINQAVRVIDGEKAYNDANLDQYLMGIKRVKPGKKNLPKLLP